MSAKFTNRSEQVTAEQKLIVGLQKHEQALPSLVIDGTSYKTADVITSGANAHQLRAGGGLVQGNLAGQPHRGRERAREEQDIHVGSSPSTARGVRQLNRRACRFRDDAAQNTCGAYSRRKGPGSCQGPGDACCASHHGCETEGADQRHRRRIAAVWRFDEGAGDSGCTRDPGIDRSCGRVRGHDASHRIVAQVTNRPRSSR